MIVIMIIIMMIIDNNVVLRLDTVGESVSSTAAQQKPKW